MSYVSHMKASNLFAILELKNLIFKKHWKTRFLTFAALMPPLSVQIELLVAQIKASNLLYIF